MEVNFVSPPPNWPSHIKYLTQPEHSLKLTPGQFKQLTSKPPSSRPSSPLPTIKLPLSSTPATAHVQIVKINNASHPAYNQFGLFATRHLPPSTLIIPYLGLVHSNSSSDTDETSDYDLSLDRDVGLSVDAGRCGNEARMANDYRGVPRPMMGDVTVWMGKKSKKGVGPNAEFRDLWFEYSDDDDDDGGGGGSGARGGRRGERGIGIFVLPAGKSGRWKEGIRAGEEVLVNYGKGFWKERGVNVVFES